MGDEQVGDAAFLLQAAQQVQHLCTDGHIQCADGRIGNDELRLHEQGPVSYTHLAGSLIHLGHGAVLHHIQHVRAHQAGQAQIDRVLAVQPKACLLYTSEERFTAALAMTSALPERIFTGEYERLFGSDAEKAETEKAQ